MQQTLLIGREFTVALNGTVKVEYDHSPISRNPQICITADKVVMYVKADQVLDAPLGMLDSVVPKLPTSPRWAEELYDTGWIR